MVRLAKKKKKSNFYAFKIFLQSFSCFRVENVFQTAGVVKKSKLAQFFSFAGYALGGFWGY